MPATAIFSPSFCQFHLTGADAKKFLQGQLTINVDKVGDAFLPCAICNLKGRVHFGLWIKAVSDGFYLVLSDDLADDFIKHIKKYGAFSKINLSAPTPIYPCLVDNAPSFCDDEKATSTHWQIASLKLGNYWINQNNSQKFQPQELRLHQRGGVDYDKGCYLGQEVVARLYFKAAPKAFLHLVHVDEPSVIAEAVVNLTQEGNGGGYLALVVMRPDKLEGIDTLTVLSLPDAISGNVARLP